MIETDWKARAEELQCRVQELEAEVEASTAIDLLGRYRRACIENATLTRRVAELESRAATAGADCGSTERQPMTARVVPVFPVVVDDAALDSLPVGSIVRDAEGDAAQCEKRPGAWFYPRERYQFTSDDIPLPAHLLWNPDWGIE